MKTLLTIFTLVFTLMFSSTSFAEWTGVVSADDGTEVYVDYERIRKHDGYVYYWFLADYLRPTEQGHLSGSGYNQGDCEIFRVKILSYIFHNQPMGRDVGETSSPENPEWIYARPGSTNESILQTVCGFTE
jgi:hypothetical protein